ncbi:MAG: ABC-F family ATP-binding cassette domain-containing protein [Calditrichaeota bacterium]|nr:ABC-F family ATP-binding cassette domain-containing protein [Calditrichota bacterium]
MSILNVNNLSHAFGGQQVFTGVTAQINRGDHIGLIGPNGVGKTTLLKLIIKQLEPSSGNITCQATSQIGYLQQNPEYHPDQDVFGEVYAGLGELKVVEDEMRILESRIKEAEEYNENNLDKLFTRYADLTDRRELLGGSNAKGRITALLEGLGIPERIWQNKMDSLSGGEKNMVGLARILIGDHDLMLLDEPGNHLDFSGLEWLENFLRSSNKAFIVVSHNRYMLDRVCSKIWELEKGIFEIYTGNYSDYRREKLTRQLAQEAAYKRAQQEIHRLEFNIARLKAWSSVYDNPKLAKTAKVFEKRVEGLKEIEKPGKDKKLRFRLQGDPPRGKIALEAKGYDKQFEPDPVLLENVNFLITQGERVAFVGDNGTGKSSLIKDVIEDGRWENPILRVGKSVTVAYYSQLGENIDLSVSVVEEAMRHTGMLRGGASDLLHRFLFTRDDLEKRVSVLSGGELSRLQLAILVHSGAGMLLLDEPTNHLDINSREAVEDALEQYPGTLVLISHDRYFLDKLADRILHFTPPDVTAYDGNFSDFWKKNRDRYRSDVKGGHGFVVRKMQSEHSSGLNKKKTRKRQKFDPQLFRKVEGEIKRLEELKPEIEVELVKLEMKGKIIRAAKRRDRLKNIDRKLDELYSEWLKLGEKKKKW